jgi:hypothetical protein
MGYVIEKMIGLPASRAYLTHTHYEDVPSSAVVWYQDDCSSAVEWHSQ